MSDLLDSGPTDAAEALTIADAARAAGTDRRSIRRLLEAGALPGAFKDEQGFWRIHSSELEAAGLALDLTVSEPAATPASEPARQPDLLQLTVELAKMEARADKAEAMLAAERRLSEELRAALLVERQTLAVMLGTDQPAAPEPRAPGRANWQHELRAARSREQQQRAARAREGDRS